MTPPCDHEQQVKIIKKPFGGTFLVRELRVLGMPDAALKAVLVQPRENLLDGRCQVKSMKPK